MPPGRPMNTPKSVIDLIWPLTRSPFLKLIANSSQGLGRHCFMPREMRRRSSSISRIITSTSSPSCTTLDGCTFLLVQSISETCTRPSMPCSIFDERAVVGEVGDLAEQARAGRVAARQAHPRVFAQLLHAQRDAVLLLVELEHLGRDLVAHIEHFGRMLDPAPGQIGDVQQAVDAAEVDERAVVGDVLDDALDHRAFGQGLQQLLRALRPGSPRARRGATPPRCCACGRA